MLKVIRFTTQPEHVNAFLNLPATLYRKKELTQSRSTEEELIKGEHILSSGFVFQPFLVYKDGKPVGRCAATLYSDRDEAYFGFFECIDDAECAGALMDAVKKYSAENGKKKLVGPVNASFWIGYRFKLDRFGSPYTGEPYNREYYPRLIENCSFGVCNTYVSNYYPRSAAEKYDKVKYSKRAERFAKAGYELRSPTDESWDEIVDDVYRLITELYKDFLTFSMISKEQFAALFADYKRILNFKYVKIAYYQGRAVGFVITIPDYGAMLYGKIGLLSIPKILKIKKKAKTYILTYLGVEPQHKGLGVALSYSVVSQLENTGAAMIGALIEKGKITQYYSASTIEHASEYALYACEIQQQ